MIPLCMPPESPEGILEECVNISRTEHLKQLLSDQLLHRQLKQAYKRFARRCPRFDEQFANANIESGKNSLLLELYKKRHSRLHKSVLNAQPDSSWSKCSCQLCGLNEPRTLDHYLGKAEFPEFAVHPWNVVPSCSVCNSPRPTFDTLGRRRIIHLLKDDVESIPQMVLAKVVSARTYLRATFTLEESFHSPLSALFRRHWETLNLKKRYEVLSPARLREMWCDVQKEPNRACAAATLCRHADAFERSRGKNNWEVALLRAAAHSDAFFAHIW